jgi:dethiobiotin synthetase
MSPLVLGSGYTKQYLEGRIDQGQQKAKICHGFERIAREKKWIVIEGTGHCGVGSVVDCNNPQVARMLGVPMLLVSSGSLSSSFDCLHLNR